MSYLNFYREHTDTFEPKIIDDLEDHVAAKTFCAILAFLYKETNIEKAFGRGGALWAALNDCYVEDGVVSDIKDYDVIGHLASLDETDDVINRLHQLRETNMIHRLKIREPRRKDMDSRRTGWTLRANFQYADANVDLILTPFTVTPEILANMGDMTVTTGVISIDEDGNPTIVGHPDLETHVHEGKCVPRVMSDKELDLTRARFERKTAKEGFEDYTWEGPTQGWVKPAGTGLKAGEINPATGRKILGPKPR